MMSSMVQDYRCWHGAPPSFGTPPAQRAKRCIAAAAALFVVLVLVSVSHAAHPIADLVIFHGDLWTVDPETPQAEALAVVGDRIVAVGRDHDISAWIGGRTRVVDAGGRLVLPGFNDAHVHFVSGGQQLEQVDLKDAVSREEFVNRVRGAIRDLEPGAWLLGGNWDDQNWQPAELPTKEWLDDFTADTPLFLHRYDGHMALANSLALERAGITSQTADPPGGTIVHGPNGEPTGILKDAAMQPVSAVIPDLTESQRLQAVRRAMKHAAQLGVTSVQAMSCSYADLAVYSQLAEANELTVRIYAAPLEMRWRDQARLGIRAAFGNAWFRIGALKGFADGSLGSSTAYFFKPYLDEPSNRGLLSEEMLPLESMRARMLGADRAGLQLCLHGIGDQAISILLDLMHDVAQTNGFRDRRFRIEHAQHVDLKDFARFQQLGVIASVQPYHAIDDGRWAEARIGPERAETTYAFRTFLEHDVMLALGTDWNVAPLNPMLTIYAAVTRATLDGLRPRGWVPDQKLTVEEAIRAYTYGSAYAEYQESVKGSLTVGKLADLVILDQNILRIDPHQIRDTQIDMTIVGGKVVWERLAKESAR